MLFDEHGNQAERFRKTFYYGELPWYSERPSLALTSLALEFFVRSLPPPDELRYLDMDYASRVMRNACVTPASVVLAMVYADRLRTYNPQYLAKTNSCDLFLVSMMVASKFLYDDGVEDEVYNDAWAKAADLEVSALNREERRFLGAINWNLFVRPAEYGTVLKDIEQRIALRELAKRQHYMPTSTTFPSQISNATYTELQVLASNPRTLAAIYNILCDYVLKVATVSLVGYCACLLTVAASVAVVHLISLVAKPPTVTPRTTTAPTSRTDNINCTGTTVRIGLNPQRVLTTRPGCAATALTPVLSVPAYSGLLLEHQKELRSVLRGDTTPHLVNDKSHKANESEPEATMDSYAVSNNTMCCLQNLVSCLVTDGLHISGTTQIRTEMTTLDIRFWELLKRVKMSTQLKGFARPYGVVSFSGDIVFA
ncbi:protein CNPPD1-like isoform X2 [Varroa jacobsoni]|uniref:Protein CNPPD1 n=1 Tax=Varroa destructor TaxID=109461 RepID=A0A7M7KCF5_VARDE|nr:protein CNPPD1-like isoform X2 [Varroa destructor]XP_022693915.1 protein CNPPD1-like isoform X2 [Varroa jacobsoni]